MKQFAKLFEIDGEQVLIIKKEDVEDEFIIEVRTQFSEDSLLGLYPTVALGYKEEKVRDEYFDSIDIEKATIFRKKIRDTLFEMTTEEVDHFSEDTESHGN